MNITRHPSPRSARRLTALAVAAASVGVLASCSSSSSSTEPADSTTSTVVAESTTTSSVDVTTSTVAAESTTTVSPTTAAPTTAAPVTTAPLPACGEGNVPSGAADALWTTNGDWNGDGVLDQATSWVEPATMDWFVMIEVVGGSSTTIAMPDPGPGFVQVLAPVDVDFSLGVDPGVNRQEFVAITSSGAAGYNLGVFGVNQFGCGFQFDNGSGDYYDVPVRASVMSTAGVACDGAAGSQFLVRLEATSNDGGVSYDTLDVKIERTGPQTLSDGVSIPGNIATDSPAAARYASADCFGTDLLADAGAM